MSFLRFLLGEKKKTASVAKERLQIILAHERSGRNPGGSPDYLPALQRDLVAVISKYVKIDPTHLKGTDVSEAYQDVVARFLGEDRPLRFVDAEKAGFLKRLFGRK